LARPAGNDVADAFDQRITEERLLDDAGAGNGGAIQQIAVGIAASCAPRDRARFTMTKGFGCAVALRSLLLTLGSISG